MITLYHGTDELEYESILKEGLIPQRGYGNGYLENDSDEFDKYLEKFLGYTFFTNDFKLASEYGNLVLEFKLPQDILLPDDIDCPEGTTWKETLDKINQVKVKGNVSIKNLIKLHFINKNYVYELNKK